MRTDQEVENLLAEGVKELREAGLPVKLKARRGRTTSRWVWATAAMLAILSLIFIPRIGARSAYALEDVLSSSADSFRVDYEWSFADGRVKKGFSYLKHGEMEAWVTEEPYKRVERVAAFSSADRHKLGFELSYKFAPGSERVLSARDLPEEWEVGQVRTARTRQVFDGARTYTVRDYDRFMMVEGGRRKIHSPVVPESPIPSVFDSLGSKSLEFSGPFSENYRGELIDSWRGQNEWRFVTLYVNPKTKKLQEIVYEYKFTPEQVRDIAPEHRVIRWGQVYSQLQNEDRTLLEIPDGFETFNADEVSARLQTGIEQGLESRSVDGTRVVLRGIWVSFKELRVLWTGGTRLPADLEPIFEVLNEGQWRILEGDRIVSTPLQWHWRDDFFKPRSESGKDGLPLALRRINGEPVHGFVMRYYGPYLAAGTPIRVAIPVCREDQSRVARDSQGQKRGYRSTEIGRVTFETKDWVDVRDALRLDSLYCGLKDVVIR